MAATYECLPVYWWYRRCRGACGRSGDCRLRLRLRCLAEAIFKAIDVGFLALLLFSTNLFFNFIGDLLLCISFFVALIMMSCMSLRLGSAPNARVFTSRLVLWSIATGAVFSFLDFLTIPAAVVALHCFLPSLRSPRVSAPSVASSRCCRRSLGLGFRLCLPGR